jgi:signal recognition particle subunit SRP19
MQLKQRNGIILWPAYFDAKKNRSEGRRVRKSLAVDTPTLAELEKCATLLGLDPVVNQKASYPRSWWEKSGMIMVKKSEKKTVILMKLAKKLKETREASLTKQKP